jgi:hypothetical protein
MVPAVSSEARRMPGRLGFSLLRPPGHGIGGILVCQPPGQIDQLGFSVPLGMPRGSGQGLTMDLRQVGDSHQRGPAPGVVSRQGVDYTDQTGIIGGEDDGRRQNKP